MSKSYQEIMDKINVTPQMRERVLSNVTNACLNKKKVIPFVRYRKYLSAAACLLVLCAGILTAPRLLNPAEPEEPVYMGSGIEEIGTIDGLSQAVGFPVSDVDGLPFDPSEKQYLSYWGEMAEIIYSDETQTLRYRKSMGAEDNSGDYSEYPATAEITAGDVTVTVKGSDDSWQLMTWTDGVFSYSVSIETGMTGEEVIRLIEANER